MTKTKKAEPTAAAGDFTNLINLMSVLAEASTRMTQLTAETQSDFLDLVDGHKPEYAALQETIMRTEEALELAARQHPEWFVDAKTIKTPFGTVSFRTSTKLEIPNEELTIVLIEQRIAAEQAQAAELGAGESASAALLRQTTSLNLEALEQLEDAELQRLRIARVRNDSFRATPLKLDLGKAVKAAAGKGEGVLA